MRIATISKDNMYMYSAENSLLSLGGQTVHQNEV